MLAEYDGRQIVGIDLHRRRTVIVRMTEAGDQLGCVRIDNDPLSFGGGDCEGWGASGRGAGGHLRLVLGRRRVAGRRRRGPSGARAGGEGIRPSAGEDERDAADLADLLRINRLPEAYVAPPAVRELRELVRHRAKLVALRSGLKAGVHAVLAKQGVLIPVSDLFGVGGRQLLDAAGLDGPYRARIHAQLRLIDAFDFEIDTVSKQLRAPLCHDHGYLELQRIPGVGPVLAAVFVAEIGEADRFRDAAHLVSWAGLTPKHRESDTTVGGGRSPSRAAA